MSGLPPHMQEKNREWWGVQCRSEAEYYSSVLSHRTLSYDQQANVSLQQRGQTYIRSAFFLLVAGDTESMRTAAEQALFFAQEALRTENFECLFPGDRQNPKYKAIEKANGYYNSYRVLHFATWFTEGKASLAIDREMSQWHLEYFKVYLFRDRRLLLDVLVDLLQAEQSQQAIETYESFFSGKSKSKIFGYSIRNKAYIAYALAQLANGDSKHDDVARRGFEYWHEKYQLWDSRPDSSGPPWWDRLNWAYLRGKYFTGVTNPFTVAEELRGF